jgi:hypothetical protein
VQQSNFVLPQWGGSDGGIVTVNKDGTKAEAKLTRTGEPSDTYTIKLVNGQTYFQRSTCSEIFRLPGGGADVLRPYLLTQTKALANARDARFEGAAVRATVEGLGSVSIKLDEKTARPEEIRGTSNGRELVWKFEDWGADIDMAEPKAPVQDRGPGGNPC